MRYGISAAALIVQEAQVLLVHHYERDAFDFWVPPGGRLEGAESIFDCAQRETFEETGLKIELERIIYIQEFFEPAAHYHFCKFFILCRAFTGALTLQNRVAQEPFLVDARLFSRTDIATVDARPEIMRDQFWADLDQGFPTVRYLGLTVVTDH